MSVGMEIIEEPDTDPVGGGIDCQTRRISQLLANTLHFHREFPVSSGVGFSVLFYQLQNILDCDLLRFHVFFPDKNLTAIMLDKQRVEFVGAAMSVNDLVAEFPDTFLILREGVVIPTLVRAIVFRRVKFLAR